MTPGYALIEWEQLRMSGIPGVAALLTLRDVTRECELETDRDRLATVAEESPYPIVEIDRHGNILYVNPAMVEVLCRFGYDLSGRPDILPDNLPALVATCLIGGRTLRSGRRPGRGLLQLDLMSGAQQPPRARLRHRPHRSACHAPGLERHGGSPS
ncbi:MAG: PAS domain-containing protein [Nitrospira sp.]|nr:PAS domain-containing protein [Nitrospira sp.]